MNELHCYFLLESLVFEHELVLVLLVVRDSGLHALLHLAQFPQTVLQLFGVDFVRVELESALFSLQHFDLSILLAIILLILSFSIDLTRTALNYNIHTHNDQQQPHRRRAEPDKQPSGPNRTAPDDQLVQRSLCSIDINRYSGLLSKVFTPEIRSYFDVNTDLVKKKLLKLIVPFKTFEWE